MNRISRNPFHSIVKKFMNSRIAVKLILGYILIIIVPTVVLEYEFYQQNYTTVKERYIKNEQEAFSVSRRNFSTQLVQIEGIYQIFNTNSDLKNYMDPINKNVADDVYGYIKYIRPLYNYSLLSSPYINNITIYEYKIHPAVIARWIRQIDTFPSNHLNIINDPSIFSGIWVVYRNTDETLDFSYYRDIYSSDYSKKLGTIKIQVDLSRILNSFSTSAETIYFYHEGNVLFQYRDGKITYLDTPIQEILPKGSNVLSLELDGVNLTAAKVVMMPGTIQYQKASLAIYVLVFCVFLSILYYIVTTSITKRILNMNKHIKQSSADKLALVTINTYHDEVGDLIHSYNEMIERINQLIHQVYQTELRTKDAEYYALQAQIKPHFLYNVLENIRMCAEKNGDAEASNMIYSLAKFMRYNFSKGKHEVLLFGELEHAKNYLDIYKSKLKDFLQVEIAVYTEIDSITCPFFILQPILENILKHAIIPKKVMHIQIIIKDCMEAGRENDVRIDISDDGLGIKPEILASINQSLKEDTYESDSHVGIENVNHRLTSYFGYDYHLVIQSTPGEGTTITIYLRRTK